MELSEEQKNIVASAIRRLDRLQPEYDASFEAYDSAKVKISWATYICGGLLLILVFESYKIQEAIGILGVASLPIIVIVFGISFFNARKEYHNQISEKHKVEQSLYDLGLSYTPVGRHFSEPYLRVIGTSEELDLSEFV